MRRLLLLQRRTFHVREEEPKEKKQTGLDTMKNIIQLREPAAKKLEQTSSLALFLDIQTVYLQQLIIFKHEIHNDSCLQ